jgi:ArsR family metal-binding transcriptional regulator
MGGLQTYPRKEYLKKLHTLLFESRNMVIHLTNETHFNTDEYWEYHAMKEKLDSIIESINEKHEKCSQNKN